MRSMLHPRRALPLSTLFLVVACEPLTCYSGVVGPVDDESIGNVRVDDIKEFPPLCVASAEFLGDVNVTSQAALDAVSGCQRVSGNIFIHDSTDIVDLSALAQLQRVEQGYISLFNNAALTEANLPALTELQSGFSALDNPELLSVLLPGLTTIKGDLMLRNNEKLNQIDVKAAQRINNAVFIINAEGFNISTGNLILADLPALTSIDGAFDALQVIEGAIDIHNTGLTSLKGLETLQEVLNTGGAATARTKFRFDALNPGLAIGIDFDDKFNIVASGNPALENFDGLQNLRTVVGDIFIGFNPSLENFVGMEDLSTINGRFFVVGNDGLQDFTGLEGDNGADGDEDGLKTINGDFFIGIFFDRLNQPKAGGNAALTDLVGLESLVTVTGDLVVAFSPQFESLQGLDRLATLGGDLTLAGVQPDTLKGALVLTTIGGDLNFGQLIRGDGLPFDPAEADPTLQLVDLAGAQQDPAVKFDPNDGQNGFDALTTVNGDLIFAFSDFNDLRMSDPDGVNNVGGANLATVGGSLILYGNDNPNTLDGIETITSLGGFVVNFAIDVFGELHPFENNGLGDFSDLDVTTLGAGGLHIGFNADINNASIDSLPDFTNVAGSVTLARVVEQNNLGPTNLAGLDIAAIGGDLTVCAIKNGDAAPIAANLGNLTALNLNGTNTVGGDVFVGFCTALNDASTSITDINGSLEFTDLPALVTLAGNNGLADVGEFLVHDMNVLTTVTLPNLADVTGNLEITRNRVLANVDLGLDDVGGDVRLIDLTLLANLDGLQGLNTVGGDLELIDLPGVQNTAGLNTVDTIDGTLRLRRLNGLTNEAREGGLQNLTANQLTSVGSLEIIEMDDLEDLAGLQTITSVDDDIVIANNAKLKTLFGLQGITAIGHKLSIVSNPNLEFVFFDDDDQNREPDVQNGIDGQQADDPDNVFESGLVTAVLRTVGEPEIVDGIVIGGRTGVIDVRNNPKLEDGDVSANVNGGIVGGLVAELIDKLNNYQGLVFFCGNKATEAVADDARFVALAECPAPQDGFEFSGPPEE